MSRTQSQGIDYFPFAVDFFSDKKVKILKARYGADGVEIYLYLLCQVYREGYYTRVDEDFLYMLSDDLSMSPEKVRLVLKFLLERSMFDEQLFKSDNVLTSAGIQERWQKAVSTRAAKTPMKVDAYWLLSEAETQPFIKVAHFSDCSEKKADNSEKNSHSSEKKAIKESKVKESKEVSKKETYKESSADGPTLNDDGTYDIEDWERRRSHASIMDEMYVEGAYRKEMEDFLRYCAGHGHFLMNEQLIDIICRLQDHYGNDDTEKIKSLERAMSGGYFDIKEGKV